MIGSPSQDMSLKSATRPLVGEARNNLLSPSPLPKPNTQRQLVLPKKQTGYDNFQLANLKNEQTDAMQILEDNQAAICMAKNAQFHGRAKHMH